VLAVLEGTVDTGEVDSGATDLPRTPFVGRRAEVAQLRAALAAMRGGEQVLVTLAGPSGIGKTALVDHLLAEIGNDVLVLRSRCYPHEVVPFEALDSAIDELSHYLVVQSKERLEALMPRDIKALCTVFPVLGRIQLTPTRTPPALEAEPHEVRRQGFRALRELFGRIADRRPVIVWIDDLQWADADSGPLLRELLRQPNAPSVLWILSYRSEDRTRSPLLTELVDLVGAARDDLCQKIVLDPLSDGESRELAGFLASKEAISSDALAAIAAESNGSPFLLHELLRYDINDMRVRGPAEFEFSQVMVARLQELSQDARLLLENVTVAAGPLDRATALDAAGLESFDPDLIADLERARLLRATSTAGRGALEIYHDRIREALDMLLTSEVRRERHGKIAAALERHTGDDARALFEHHRGAGAYDRAAVYAIRAGDQAAVKLAFDQAAYLYRSALELDRSAIDERPTLVKLGDALANAGRGRAAANAFESAAGLAAEDANLSQSVHLHCRSAEQFLVSGHVEDGIRVLRPLLSQLGIAYPSSEGRALLATVGRLPQLALRYQRFRPRLEAKNLDAALLAIDACHTSAKGLVVVDPARAAYFSVRSLIGALQSGDPWRTGRALCVVGAAIAPIGGPISAWARSMLRWGRRIADECGDPYLLGMASISQAQVHFVDGHWAAMLEGCDRGTKLLMERCQGVRWECDVGNMGALRALEELGRIRELDTRVARLIEEAIGLDDVYAQVTFRLFGCYWLIAKGEIDAARRGTIKAMDLWGRDSLQLQHLYELRIQAYCDLYQGDPQTACQRVESAWPALRASNLLRHPLLASDAYQLRANVALSLAALTRGDKMLRIAASSARALRMLRRADATAAARRIRAAIALLSGDRAGAVHLLDDAVSRFVQADMPLHAAYLQRRRSALSYGDDSETEVQAADDAIRGRGVRDPVRWLAIQAPGLNPSCEGVVIDGAP